MLTVDLAPRKEESYVAVAVDNNEQQVAGGRSRGSLILLLSGIVLGIACYWLGWFIFSGVSSPSDLSTKLYPLIPAGLVFLHFYIRWYAAEHWKETEVSQND